ncbi:uncharacterized protein LOC126987612 [Eriocheir sinensis]|uniref:uncharacterized protein LOC126987612 n=1 Tax=Eriocheir sinensis TaxID=95602 RepID=UPI0021C91DF2|nr:uncharacterized protein LOC126987612 [Eriocheir sinensis]
MKKVPSSENRCLLNVTKAARKRLQTMTVGVHECKVSLVAGVAMLLVLPHAPSPAHASFMLAPEDRSNLIDYTPTPVEPHCEVRQIPRLHTACIAVETLVWEYEELDPAPRFPRITTTHQDPPSYSTTFVYHTVKPQVLQVTNTAFTTKPLPITKLVLVTFTTPLIETQRSWVTKAGWTVTVTHVTTEYSTHTRTLPRPTSTSVVKE